MTTFVGDFKLLKVLDFQNSSLSYLPEAVGKVLFHLYYLNLRNTGVKKLPKSIGKLVNLETLDLTLSRVKKLPAEIKNLKKLRYLRVYNLHIIGDVIGTGRGITIQKGFGTLTDLQKLYSVRADTEVLKELMMLRKLGKLGITLTNGSGKYLCDFIAKMEHLESLIVDSTSRKEIIDIECVSSPPRYLKRLCLTGTMKKMPIWIRELEDLNRIDLDLSGLREDPISILHSLPNLFELRLKDTYHDKHLHFKDGWFPKLQQLSLLIFSGLEMVTIDKGAIPDLRHLEIGPSPLLKDNITGIEHLGKLEGFKSIYKLSSTVMGKYLTKIVLKVALGCNKYRSKALKIAAAVNGVTLVALEGEEKDRLVAIGDQFDPIDLIFAIRKKIGYAELITVEKDHTIRNGSKCQF
ncbi:disease resistance protein RPM1-like isoform X2 [Pistacia vera]|uniref:disease resistance protein RPM1-like isoform X2 n=1 Tax=Pistacia vera TaxID=55513 RepID=UPI00126365C8|nr:disease resistance protein RPM1-like isoform X2 [Pistacia vera]